MLFKRWVLPTIKSRGLKFIPSATKDVDKIESHLYQLHLKILTNDHNPRIDNFDLSNDFRKAQFFAIQCQVFQQKPQIFQRIILFLEINANTDSRFLRNEIFAQFKSLFVEVLKKPTTQVESCCSYLYDFLMSCFEIGNTYQREIFGLNIFRIVLCYLGTRSIETFRVEEYFCQQIRQFEAVERMISEGELGLKKVWIFTDRKMMARLLRLVLDPANDVRQISADLLVQFFDWMVLEKGEREVS